MKRIAIQSLMVLVMLLGFTSCNNDDGNGDPQSQLSTGVYKLVKVESQLAADPENNGVYNVDVLSQLPQMSESVIILEDAEKATIKGVNFDFVFNVTNNGVSMSTTVDIATYNATYTTTGGNITFKYTDEGEEQVAVCQHNGNTISFEEIVQTNATESNVASIKETKWKFTYEKQ